MGLDDAWEDLPSKVVVRRGGTLICWQVHADASPDAPFRIVGAHTDSPGFRIKPRPDASSAGWQQLGVEVYGGPLLNSWLDRDLGIAGRVAVGAGADRVLRLVRDDRALLRIPQLAIHLDRELGEQGLKLDRQRHVQPVWGVEGSGGQPRDFVEYLADLLDVAAGDIGWWDLAPFDLTPARVAGPADELLVSARLDDLVSCHTAITALRSAQPNRHIALVGLFDHEEVGSGSADGAGGALLSQVIERVALARGATRADHLRSLAASHAISADMAHATHPNYPERHEPSHPISVNAGPVVKVNAQQRYATDASSAGPFLDACRDADVPVQRFVSHSSLPCGSTIGPMTAARLGIPVVDVGVAQLAMHSVREVCGAVDPGMFTRALQQYFMDA